MKEVQQQEDHPRPKKPSKAIPNKMVHTCSCGQNFGNATARGVHQIRVHSAQFKCDKCSMDFLCEESCKNHQESLCSQSNEGCYQAAAMLLGAPISWSCFCGEVFRSQEARGIHQVIVHSFNFECNQCKRFQLCEEALERHFSMGGICHRSKRHRKAKKRAQDIPLSVTRRLVCTTCEQAFESTDTLLQHSIHDLHGCFLSVDSREGAELLCHCGEPFYYIWQLINHQYHNHRTLVCPTCSEKFLLKSNMHFHLLKNQHGRINGMNKDNQSRDELELDARPNEALPLERKRKTISEPNQTTDLNKKNKGGLDSSNAGDAERSRSFRDYGRDLETAEETLKSLSTNDGLKPLSIDDGLKSLSIDDGPLK